MAQNNHTNLFYFGLIGLFIGDNPVRLDPH